MLRMTQARTWEDKNLFDSYINYCNSIKKSSEKSCLLCYGTTTPFADKSSKGIVRQHMEQNLYQQMITLTLPRGRFSKWEEAAIIGLEASQKHITHCHGSWQIKD